MITELDILKEARRLIDEKGWTQGAFARDISGSPASNPGSMIATRFCVAGACLAASSRLEGDPDQDRTRVRLSALGLFREVNDVAETPAWNDAPSRTKDDVLRAFDRAIAEAEKGAAA